MIVSSLFVIYQYIFRVMISAMPALPLHVAVLFLELVYLA